MFELVWNKEGAARAENLTKSCVWGHDKYENRATNKYEKGGQNLYITSGTSNWKNVITHWHNETRMFTFGKDRNKFEDVGHYTQIVWGTTKEIGCGMHNCPQGKMYACNYYPGGNHDPYYEPYEKSDVQSCNGCIKGGECSKNGVYAGKLLISCDQFCVNEYSNCDDLANQGYCSQLMDKCAKSCKHECKLGKRTNQNRDDRNNDKCVDKNADYCNKVVNDGYCSNSSYQMHCVNSCSPECQAKDKRRVSNQFYEKQNFIKINKDGKSQKIYGKNQNNPTCGKYNNCTNYPKKSDNRNHKKKDSKSPKTQRKLKEKNGSSQKKYGKNQNNLTCDNCISYSKKGHRNQRNDSKYPKSQLQLKGMSKS
ncbi:unnamed protein product [Gordionus sp. m RMFG-2023]